MSYKGNELVIGTDTQIWLNGTEYTVDSFEYKNIYDTAETKIGYETFQTITGMRSEGTLSLNKTGSLGLKLMEGVSLSRMFPDITITSKIVNKSTGKAERLIFRNVTISEVGASSANGEVMKEELPFKSSIGEVLEYM